MKKNFLLTINQYFNINTKIFLTCIVTLILTNSVFALHFTEGKEYICVDKPVTCVPKVLEFFSFYCQHCYFLDQIYKLDSRVTKLLPAHTKVTKYHVDYLGPLSKQLTQAWAVAMILGIEDKISPLMFYAVQQAKSVHNKDDIRSIFIKAGVSPQEYDAIWNSYEVHLLQNKQENAAIHFQLQSVPSLFINGKYMIKHDSFNMKSMDRYIIQISNIITYLLNK